MEVGVNYCDVLQGPKSPPLRALRVLSFVLMKGDALSHRIQLVQHLWLKFPITGPVRQVLVEDDVGD